MTKMSRERDRYFAGGFDVAVRDAITGAAEQQPDQTIRSIYTSCKQRIIKAE